MPSLSSKSPFVDLGQTHTFSDWLLASALDLIDGNMELSPGGLPDLSSVISGRGKRKIIENKLAEFWRESSSPLKIYLEQNLGDRDFIDLGCGDPEKSLAGRLVAEICGCKTYVGVDLQHVKKSSGLKTLLGASRTSEKVCRQDFCDFLKKYKRQGPSCFFLAGIDPKPDAALSYVRNLRDLLLKAMRKGDLIILGVGTTGFGFSAKVLKRRSFDAFHEIYERR